MSEVIQKEYTGIKAVGVGNNSVKIKWCHKEFRLLERQLKSQCCS